MPTDLNNPAFLYRYRPLTADAKNPQRDVVADEINLIKQGLIWTSPPKDLESEMGSGCGN